MYQFYLADDHPLYRDALQLLLRQQWPDCQLTQTASLAELLHLLQHSAEPDLLLLDVNMPGSAGLDGLRQLKQQFLQVPVAMLSAEDDKQTILQAMALGAVGFISKAADKQQLLAAIQQLLAGNIYLPAQSFRQTETALSAAENSNAIPEKLAQLTRQQRRVLAQLLQGASNKQIAEALFIAETTVKAHVTAIFDKLGVQNRMQLLAQANQTDFNKYLS